MTAVNRAKWSVHADGFHPDLAGKPQYDHCVVWHASSQWQPGVMHRWRSVGFVTVRKLRWWYKPPAPASDLSPTDPVGNRGSVCVGFVVTAE
ncbi:hypothetical protein DVW31_16250, partial [Enterococcus faecium]